MLPAPVACLLSKLHTAGFEAYAVGGCVRDLLRGAEPQDWDVCTSALPQEIKTCFAGVPVIETGLKHGTVTLRLEKQSFEITTYRADGPYSDGRHPDAVRFVPSLTEDLARRDFTINAMAMDLSGAVIDPFGGAADLRNRVIRCVGDGERRFREDGLRLMRCLRFSACLGFAVEEATAQALRRSLPMLDRVAAERIRAELCKLLMGQDRVAVLRGYPEVFCRFWPELEPLVTLEQRTPWHRYGGWEHTLHALAAAPEDLTVRLAVLLHDVGKPACKTTDEAGVDHFYGHAAAGAALADQMLRNLKFDNDTRKHVVKLVERHDAPILETEQSVRRWLGRLGPETFFRLLEVKRCDAIGQENAETPNRLRALETLRALARTVIAQGQCFSLRDLAVNGRDVIAAGIPPGPRVGDVLADLLERVVNGQLPNRRETLLKEIAAK